MEGKTTRKPALKTPGERRILAYPIIQNMLELWGVDTEENSSLQAVLNLRISHKAATHLATITGQDPPPPPDLTAFAPLSPDAAIRLQTLITEFRQNAAPPGIIISPEGKRTFDTAWRDKQIHPTDLPADHPDHSPF